MKKICYVATIPETIKAFFVSQLKYLAENGYDVSVICSPDETLQNELGPKVNFIPIDIPRGLSVIGSVKALLGIYKTFRKNGFDLIQYSTPNAAFYASIASKLVGCKIRNYHLMGFRYLGANGFGRFILKTMEKYVCRLSTSIECVSKSNLELGISEKIFPKEKAVVVWNGSTGGIDLERFNASKRTEYREEIRKKYNIDADDFVFGFVGRITKDKGLNEILEAFLNINNAKLMLIGYSEGEDTLDKNLYKSSLVDSDIIYTGPVSDVEKYYCALDTLLLPSYREGFGNVIIEAGAMGTPAIVSNIPGPTDAIENEKTALVVNVRDSKSLEKAMKTIMADSLYKTMGEDSCSFVESHFDSTKLCEYILKRKNELVNN